MAEQPVVVGVGGDIGALERIRPQVEDLWHPQLGERFRPHTQRALGALLEEQDLPVAESQRHQIAVVGDVEEMLSRALVRLAGQVRQLVVPIEMHLVVRAVQSLACLATRRKCRGLPRQRETWGTSRRGSQCR